jgi:hypothetical protein
MYPQDKELALHMWFDNSYLRDRVCISYLLISNMYHGCTKNKSEHPPFALKKPLQGMYLTNGYPLNKKILQEHLYIHYS